MPIIDEGANLGIAYAMYGEQESVTPRVSLEMGRSACGHPSPENASLSLDRGQMQEVCLVVDKIAFTAKSVAIPSDTWERTTSSH